MGLLKIRPVTLFGNEKTRHPFIIEIITESISSGMKRLVVIDMNQQIKKWKNGTIDAT